MLIFPSWPVRIYWDDNGLVRSPLAFADAECDEPASIPSLVRLPFKKM